MAEGTVTLEVAFAIAIIMGFIALPTLSCYCLQWPVMEWDGKSLIIQFYLPASFFVLKVEYDELRNAIYLTSSYKLISINCSLKTFVVL